MRGYVAVDCGKYNTKINYYNPSDGENGKIRYRTKISTDATFEDDMFDKGTFIVQIDDGPVHKVGNDAKTEPSMETSKMSDVHRVCTMTAVALAAGKMQADETVVAIGIPLQTAGIPEERIAYKDFILGKEGKHTVRIKTDCNTPPAEITFNVCARYVYPESIGTLYEYPGRVDGPTAVIDIGNLNTNNTYTDGFHIITESCFTDELGGKVLISGLAQQLTGELRMRCDDNLAASTLLRPYEQRFLKTRNKNQAVEQKSREIIDAYLLEHVNAIKARCDTRHWPLDFMNIICVGGTSRLLSREIGMVFGEDAFIPENPEFVNACGFLKRVCAADGIDITGGGNA